jgi:hypothetical protein
MFKSCDDAIFFRSIFFNHGIILQMELNTIPPAAAV